MNLTTDEIAYHEAGHAIIAFACGVDVCRLSILSSGSCQGGCEIDGEIGFLRSANCDLDLAQLLNIAFFLAGRVAHRKYLFHGSLDIDEMKIAELSGYDSQMVENRLSLIKKKQFATA